MSNFLIERRTEEIRGGGNVLLRTDTWWEVTLEEQGGYDKVKVFKSHEEATAWLEDQDLEPKALCHERRHQVSEQLTPARLQELRANTLKALPWKDFDTIFTHIDQQAETIRRLRAERRVTKGLHTKIDEQASKLEQAEKLCDERVKAVLVSAADKFESGTPGNEYLYELADEIDLDMGAGYTGGDDQAATNIAADWIREKARKQ